MRKVDWPSDKGSLYSRMSDNINAVGGTPSAGLPQRTTHIQRPSTKHAHLLCMHVWDIQPPLSRGVQWISRRGIYSFPLSFPLLSHALLGLACLLL